MPCTERFELDITLVADLHQQILLEHVLYPAPASVKRNVRLFIPRTTNVRVILLISQKLM